MFTRLKKSGRYREVRQEGTSSIDRCSDVIEQSVVPKTFSGLLYA